MEIDFGSAEVGSPFLTRASFFLRVPPPNVLCFGQSAPRLGQSIVGFRHLLWCSLVDEIDLAICNETTTGSIMALTCSSCGAKVELSDDQRRQLAGKFFACPECGVTKRIPPATDDGGKLNGDFLSHVHQRHQHPQLWKPSVLVVAFITSGLVMYLVASLAFGKRAPSEEIAANHAAQGELPAEVAPKPVLPEPKQEPEPKPERKPEPPQRSIVRQVVDAVTEPAKPPIVSPPRGSAPDLAKADIDNGMLKEVRQLLRNNLPTGQWDELAWWPSRYLEAGGHRRLMARMKIRTTNRLGALDVMDLLFLVDAEKSEIRIAVSGGVDDDFAVGGRDAFDRGITRIFTTQDAAARML